MADRLELLTIGRVSVDLYAEQLGVPIREVRTFRKSVGGTATNVAVAASRLGHHTAVLTKVGDDAFGDYVRWALDATFGVDTRFVGVHPTLRTPLAFAELDPPDDPTITFYREPAAPDLSIEPDDVDGDVVASVPILWVSAGALAAEPSRGTVHGMLRTRAARAETVVDLDWRPQLWDAPASATRELDTALPARDHRHRQPRRVRGRRRHGRPRRGRRPAARSRPDRCDRQARRRRGVGGDGRRQAARPGRTPWTSYAGSGPATRSAAPSATDCWRDGSAARVRPLRQRRRCDRRRPPDVCRRHADTGRDRRAGAPCC